MTLPGALIAFVIASVIGLIYHLFRDGGFRRLILYVIVAWVGFFAGHGIGGLLRWNTLRFGSLNILPAVLITCIALIVAEILAGPRPRPRSSSRKPRPPVDGDL
jgi:hypothetical protein